MALNIGIKTQLNSLLLLIIAVCFSIVVVVVGVTTYKFTTNLEGASLNQYSKDLASSLDDAISNLSSNLNALIATGVFEEPLSTNTNLTRTATLLNNLVDTYPLVDAIVLVNNQNYGVIANQSASSLRNTDFTTNPVLNDINRTMFNIDPTPIVTPTGGNYFVIPMTKMITNTYGETIGFAILFIDLTKMSNTYLSQRAYNDNGTAFVVNAQGQYVLHSNPTKILAQEANRSLLAFINTVTQETSSEEYTDGNITYFAGIQSLKALPWYVVVTMPITGIKDIQARIFTVIIPLSMAVTLLILIVFNLVIQHRFVKRILTLKTSMDFAGNGDLTVQPTITGSDEIAKTGTSFNNLVGGLNSLLTNITGKMQELTTSSVELSNCIKSTIVAVDNIDGSMRHAQREIVNQNKSIESTSKSVRIMSQNVENLDNTINEHTQAIQTSSHSMQNMLNNVNTIAKMMNTSNEYATTLKAQSKEGEQRLAKAIKEINHVAQSSNQLVKANSLVAKVASKTTILAMNAAIEAAHAGAQGSGFAVVADEVRNLAELSTSQSRNIQKIISDIANLINVAVASNYGTQEVITKIFQTVNLTEGLMSDISKLMNEQTADSRGLLQGLDSMRKMALTVKNESNSLISHNTDILKQVDTLLKTSGNMGKEFNNVVAQLQEINQVIEVIKYLDTKNRNSIGTVLLASTRFKTTNEDDDLVNYLNDSGTKIKETTEENPTEEQELDDSITLF